MNIASCGTTVGQSQTGRKTGPPPCASVPSRSTKVHRNGARRCDKLHGGQRLQWEMRLDIIRSGTTIRRPAGASAFPDREVMNMSAAAARRFRMLWIAAIAALGIGAAWPDAGGTEDKSAQTSLRLRLLPGIANLQPFAAPVMPLFTNAHPVEAAAVDREDAAAARGVSAVSPLPTAARIPGVARHSHHPQNMQHPHIAQKPAIGAGFAIFAALFRHAAHAERVFPGRRAIFGKRAAAAVPPGFVIHAAHAERVFPGRRAVSGKRAAAAVPESSGFHVRARSGPGSGRSFHAGDAPACRKRC